MKKLLLLFLGVILSLSPIFASATIYGVSGAVTYPSAETSSPLNIDIKPYVIAYGSDTWYSALSANVGVLPGVEVYGSTAFYASDDFSIGDLTTYGAKVQAPLGIKNTKVAGGATMYTNDSSDVYVVASNKIVDVKLADLTVSGGLNYHTQKNSGMSNTTRGYVGASLQATSMIRLSAEASLPIFGDGDTIYSAGATVNLPGLSLSGGITNNEYGVSSKSTGYYFSLGFGFGSGIK